MKVTLLTLFFAAFASVALSKPFPIEGAFYKTKNVIPMARIHYVIANSMAEVNELKRREYTCQRIDARQLCQKLATRNFELPVEVRARLWEMAFNSIIFSRSQSDYVVVNESERMNEWQRDQIVEIDKLRFENLNWREIADPRGLITRVIVSSRRHDAKGELIILSSRDIGVVTKLRVNNQKGWNEYWGVVQYLP